MTDSLTVRLYEILTSLPRCTHETPDSELPPDGIYVFFEKGEVVTLGNGPVDRIVRVGINESSGRFRPNLRDHYGPRGSDLGRRSSSAFRRMVAAALLRKAQKAAFGLERKVGQDSQIERRVSDVLRKRFTFCCLWVPESVRRVRWEEGLIAMLARDPLGRPSRRWLGLSSPDATVREFGLWNHEHVGGAPLNGAELQRISRRVPPTLRLGWAPRS